MHSMSQNHSEYENKLKFFKAKFQTEAESTHLNCLVCALSDFKKQPFSGSSLKYISLYFNNTKGQFYQVETSRKASGSSFM